MKALYRTAQVTLSIARLIGAAFYGPLAILLIGFALLLAFRLGQSWLFPVIAILVELQEPSSA